jgi:hypothetical protein
MGGAWQWAAMPRAKESSSWDSQDAAITANTTGENDAPCTDEGCTKGACIVGMVLQQSCPWWPCDEQCIDLQHCIACSGVVAASQSNAYAPRATARIATNNGLMECIIDQLRHRRCASQLAYSSILAESKPTITAPSITITGVVM